MSKNKLGPWLIALSSLLWASDAPFRKPLLTGGLGAGFIALLEHLFSTLVSLPGLIKNLKEFKTLKLRHWLGLVYIGAGASALGAIFYVKGAVAMNYNFTVVALLQKLQPLFAITLAVLFLKEKLSAKFWVWALPALLGAYLTTFGLTNPSELWHTASGKLLLGPTLALGAALLWAGGTVVGRALMTNLSLPLVNGSRFLFGFLFLYGYVLYFEKMQFNLLTPLFWRNIIIIALLTGFFALLIYYQGLKNTKASVATIMELGYPLAITVVNWIFLDITLSLVQIIGGLVLLASITALTYENSKISEQEFAKK